jgi:hypothetical protein
MLRRLASTLLATLLAFGAVIAAPCAASATCVMARHMHCCATAVGLHARGCCDGVRQVGRVAPAATAVPQMSSAPVPPSAGAVPTAVWVASPPVQIARAPVPGPAPPGRSLLTQSTSLLL